MGWFLVRRRSCNIDQSGVTPTVKTKERRTFLSFHRHRELEPLLYHWIGVMHGKRAERILKELNDKESATIRKGLLVKRIRKKNGLGSDEVNRKCFILYQTIVSRKYKFLCK